MSKNKVINYSDDKTIINQVNQSMKIGFLILLIGLGLLSVNFFYSFEILIFLMSLVLTLIGVSVVSNKEEFILDGNTKKIKVIRKSINTKMKSIVDIIPFSDVDGFYIKEEQKRTSDSQGDSTKVITIFNIELKTKNATYDFLSQTNFNDYDKATLYVVELNNFLNKYKDDKINYTPEVIKDGDLLKNNKGDINSNVADIALVDIDVNFKHSIGLSPKSNDQYLLLEQGKKARKFIGYLIILINIPMIFGFLNQGEIISVIFSSIVALFGLLLVLYISKIEFDSVNQKIKFTTGLPFYNKEEDYSFNKIEEFFVKR